MVDIDSGKSLGPGEHGEVWVRGPQVMKSYMGASETAHLSDGWFRTGDIGYFTEDGFYYIVDRLKEVIKYKGYQVPPADLEAIIMEIPGVADCAVIGVPDEEVGELPKAVVQLSDGASVDEAAIMAYVAERVTPYQKIRLVEFVKLIPRQPSGFT